MSKCSILDCSKPVKAKGLCGTHYQRQFRTGDATTVRKPGPKPRNGRGPWRERTMWNLWALGSASDRSESRSHRSWIITSYLDERAEDDGCDVPFPITDLVADRTSRRDGSENFARRLEYAETLWWVAENDPDGWAQVLRDARQRWNTLCHQQGNPELAREASTDSVPAGTNSVEDDQRAVS